MKYWLESLIVAVMLNDQSEVIRLCAAINGEYETLCRVIAAKDERFISTVSMLSDEITRLERIIKQNNMEV